MEYLAQEAIERSAIYAETIGSILKVFSDPTEKFENLVVGFKDWKIGFEILIKPIISNLL